jgi:hypothetical protein
MTEESCPTIGRLKGPALSIIHAPVLACDSVFGGVRMSVDCPAPQYRIERVVQLLEESRAPHGSVIEVMLGSRFRGMVGTTTNRYLEASEQLGS